MCARRLDRSRTAPLPRPATPARPAKIRAPQVELLGLQEKELQFHLNNCLAIALQAAIVGGMGYIGLIEIQWHRAGWEGGAEGILECIDESKGGPWCKVHEAHGEGQSEEREAGRSLEEVSVLSEHTDLVVWGYMMCIYFSTFASLIACFIATSAATFGPGLALRGKDNAMHRCGATPPQP